MDIISWILGYKNGLKKGGGSGADFSEIDSILDEINGEIIGAKIVTFMVEGEVWAKVEVAPGGTCPDPSQNSTPTKAPTVDTVFPFRGWSLMDDNTVDSNALTNVTSDRVVYAVFGSSIRTYPITFSDTDGTILYRKNVPYDTVPSYTPYVTRDDAYFDGWTPEPVAVTGAATYTIIWTPYPAFQTGTWEEIASVLNAGEAANSFSVGDRRAIPLNYADGTGETIYFTIVDINADTKQDGKAAQITLMADNALKDSTKLATPPADPSTSIYRYNLMSAALDRFYAALPAEMQALAVAVKRSTGGLYRTVFLPTYKNLTGEVGVDNTANTQLLPDKQYAHFAAGNTIGRKKLGASSNSAYFTSSLYSPTNGSYVAVSAYLNVSEADKTVTEAAVVPCICLG